MTANTSAAPPTNTANIGAIHAMSTFIVFVVLAILINTFLHNVSLLAMLKDGMPWWVQIGAGALIGLIVALLDWLFFAVGGRFVKLLNEVWLQTQHLMRKFDITGLNPIWFALCAGIGEELLFRGALQPIIGIWWVAILFAVVHAGTGELFRTPNWKKLVYILSTLVASVVLSYVFVFLGLIAAMVAHTVIDIVALLIFKYYAKRDSA